MNGVRLRAQRMAAGLTLENVADALGVRHTSVLAWEQGKKNPTADKLPRLAEILGCTIDDLFAKESA